MKRLSNAALGDLPADVGAPALRPRARRDWHRASRRRRVPARASGDVHRGRARRGRHALGHCRREPAVARGARRAQAAGRALHAGGARRARARQLQVIGAIKDVLVAPEDPQALLARADRSGGRRIVTLTVTEKGYCYDPATAALDETHPDIVHDLANPDAPRSVPGFLVEALRRRRAAQVPALHGAVLRQPPAQRAHGRRHRDALRGAARSGARGLHPQRGRCSPPRWSTASRRRRPMRTAPRSRARLGR